MDNPFEDDSEFDMTRATEAASGETRDSSQDSQAGQAAATKKVCPFCGAINDNDGNACPRCLMEDTQTTRSATKSRIGPWFVLQARNPAAPGMKWHTLIELVRKGVVVPRSIVRGPTTHQLWRAAGHVKGLSREFGLCYHCGGDIDKGANQCPHCNKLQEPPINPDSLLESREPMVRRDLPREAGMPQRDASPMRAVSPAPAPVPMPMPQAPAPVPQPVPQPPSRDILANSDLDALAADLERFVAPASTNASSAMNLPTDFVIPKPPERTFSKPDAGILSAKELAAAFQLDFQPNPQAAPTATAQLPAPRPTKPAGKSRPVLRTFVLLIFLAAIGGVTFFYLKPEYREPALAWVQKNYASVKNSIEGKVKSTPPAMGTSTQAPTTPDSHAPAATPVEHETVAKHAPEVVVPKETVAQQPPAPAPKPEAKARVDTPPVVVDVPKPQPEAQVPPPAPAPSEPQMSFDEAYDKYRALWSAALDAEAKQDLPLAIEKYEAIQKLPKDVWPKDLTERLSVAKRRLGRS
jgi:hypothetical protein